MWICHVYRKGSIFSLLVRGEEEPTTEQKLLHYGLLIAARWLGIEIKIRWLGIEIKIFGNAKGGIDWLKGCNDFNLPI